MVDETAQVFSNWLALVTESQVQGKRTHDARIASVMLAAGISHILTLNPKDFLGLPGIVTTRPQEIRAGG